MTIEIRRMTFGHVMRPAGLVDEAQEIGCGRPDEVTALRATSGQVIGQCVRLSLP